MMFQHKTLPSLGDGEFSWSSGVNFKGSALTSSYKTYPKRIKGHDELEILISDLILIRKLLIEYKLTISELVTHGMIPSFSRIPSSCKQKRQNSKTHFKQTNNPEAGENKNEYEIWFVNHF